MSTDLSVLSWFWHFQPGQSLGFTSLTWAVAAAPFGICCSRFTYFPKSEIQKCPIRMGNIQPDVSPCPTFTVLQKSFANLTFQTAPSRRKLLVRCPRNCHLIIACHFTCQPRTYLTKAISCPLCTSSDPPPIETLAVKMQFFAPTSGPKARFRDTRRRICRTVNLFTTHPIYSTSVNLSAAFSRVLL